MIGDSHLTMMVEANREFFSPSLDIATVTWPRQFEDQFSFDGVELRAGGDGLEAFWKKCDLPKRIDLTQFDQISFVSHTVTMFSIFKVLQDHIVSNWNGAASIIRALHSSPSNTSTRRLLTASAFQECLVGMIRSNYAFRIASELRRHSTVSICVLPPPFLADTTLMHRPNLTGLKRILKHDDGALLAACYNQAHVAAFGDIPHVTVVTQPDQTLTRGCLTKDMYRAGAKRFGTNVAHREDDVMHAGPLLGQLLLNEIISAQTA